MLSFLGGMLVMLMTLVSVHSGALGKVRDVFCPQSTLRCVSCVRSLTSLILKRFFGDAVE